MYYVSAMYHGELCGTNEVQPRACLRVFERNGAAHKPNNLLLISNFLVCFPTRSDRSNDWRGKAQEIPREKQFCKVRYLSVCH